MRDEPNQVFWIDVFILIRSSNPEDRRISPENVNGRRKFKVVYVVLESQYQSSMTVACKRINAAQVRLRDCCDALFYYLTELGVGQRLC